MSFVGTPLGQGRRVDHQTFLRNKPPSTSNRPPSPHQLVPTSYAYSLSNTNPRSPQKAASARGARLPADHSNDENDSALARYAKIKEREQFNLADRPGGPKIITSPPHSPEKWPVKDTTVNVATAFFQAAQNDSMQVGPQNNAWASGSTRSNTAVPRSTSVEYESQQQSASSRRLGAPPSRIGPSQNINRSNKPLSKSSSVRYIPDSQPEDSVSQSGRGKSPFDRLRDGALGVTEFFVRQRSREPETSSHSLTNGKDSSYDYSREEQEFQAAQKQRVATHRKNRMSTDNKAYKPSKQSEDEEEDDDVSDDGKPRKRKKKKKDLVGGPLNTLPVIPQDKRRRRKKGSKGNIGEGEDSESEGSGSERQPSAPRSIASRTSAHNINYPDLGDSFDSSGLHSIPEEEGPEVQLSSGSIDLRGKAHPLTEASGRLVFAVYSLLTNIITLIWTLVCNLTFICGRILGTIFDIILNRPVRWVAHSGPLITFGKWVLVAGLLLGLWIRFQEPIRGLIPEFPSRGYSPSNLPAADMSQLNERLRKIESTLVSLSNDASRTSSRLDTEVKSLGKLPDRIERMEVAITQRTSEVESGLREATAHSLESFKKVLDELQKQLDAVQNTETSGTSQIGTDEEAHAKLKALEERIGSVEGGVKEALELGKNSIKTSTSRWGGSQKGLTIKSSDGQDVSALIDKLVKDGISLFGKDRIGRRDFALYSAGGRVVPSLTSKTLEIKPRGIRGRLVYWATGDGYAVASPPVTALHEGLNPGHCWPFPGSSGQLGVWIPSPVYITDITIDHVAPELAHNMNSAPRQMEVWGLVEGRDNIAKLKTWLEVPENRLEHQSSYPKTLPKSPQYLRIASFTYDIHSDDNIQTFPILPEIRELGIDFGIVALVVKNNWGSSAFTCLYRFRVHGDPLPPSSISR